MKIRKARRGGKVQFPVVVFDTPDIKDLKYEVVVEGDEDYRGLMTQAEFDALKTKTLEAAEKARAKGQAGFEHTIGEKKIFSLSSATTPADLDTFLKDLFWIRGDVKNVEDVPEEKRWSMSTTEFQRWEIHHDRENGLVRMLEGSYRDLSHLSERLTLKAQVDPNEPSRLNIFKGNEQVARLGKTIEPDQMDRFLKSVVRVDGDVHRVNWEPKPREWFITTAEDERWKISHYKDEGVIRIYRAFQILGSKEHFAQELKLKAQESPEDSDRVDLYRGLKMEFTVYPQREGGFMLKRGGKVMHSLGGLLHGKPSDSYKVLKSVLGEGFYGDMAAESLWNVEHKGKWVDEKWSSRSGQEETKGDTYAIEFYPSQDQVLRSTHSAGEPTYGLRRSSAVTGRIKPENITRANIRINRTLSDEQKKQRKKWYRGQLRKYGVPLNFVETDY